MRNHFFITVMMVAMISLQLFAEPVYQGKPESFWGNLLANLNSFQNQKDRRELGADATEIWPKAIESRNVSNANLIRSNAARQLQNFSDPAMRHF